MNTLKYVSKLQGHFVKSLDNFRNFDPIEVFSSGMSSQYYEDNFQTFYVAKNENLDEENDAGKFSVFCKTHFHA